MLIGIKSSLDPVQLSNKIFPGLKLLEIHLYERDVRDKESTRKALHELHKKHKLQFMLHSPIVPGKKDALAIGDKDCQLLEDFTDLACNTPHVLGGVMHTESADYPFFPDDIQANLMMLRRKYPVDEKLYFENLTLSTSREGVFKDYIERFSIKKVCVDITHFTKYHSEDELMAFFDWLHGQKIPYYVHIGDNNPKSGNHMPMNLGKGSLDFSRIAPYVDFGVIETFPADEQIGTEVIEDYKKFIYFTSL